MVERIATRIDKSASGKDMVMLYCDSANGAMETITHVDGVSDWVLFKDKYTAFRYFTLTSMKTYPRIKEAIKLGKLKLKDEMGLRVLNSIKDSHPELFV